MCLIRTTWVLISYRCRYTLSPEKSLSVFLSRSAIVPALVSGSHSNTTRLFIQAAIYCQ
jgi:hypothetical protein